MLVASPVRGTGLRTSTVSPFPAEIVQRLQDPLRWVDLNVTLPELYQPGVTRHGVGASGSIHPRMGSARLRDRDAANRTP
jgi:hypothetical protein